MRAGVATVFNVEQARQALLREQARSKVPHTHTHILEINDGQLRPLCDIGLPRGPGERERVADIEVSSKRRASIPCCFGAHGRSIRVCGLPKQARTWDAPSKTAGVALMVDSSSFPYLIFFRCQ